MKKIENNFAVTGFVGKDANYDEIFCPSKKKCYFGGQMGDKMGDNLQISKLKIKNLQK